MVFSLITTAKSFSDPWVGHAGLNRAGLHKARVKIANRLSGLRRWQSLRQPTPYEHELLNNGAVAIPNLLPDQDFRDLYAEVSEAAKNALTTTPYPEPKGKGFGKENHHDWGFDRFDGSTLNRFIAPGPHALAFARQPLLAKLARVVTGRAHNPRKGWIYETVSADDSNNRDIQRNFHRDTFFNALKYWFFLEPVSEEDGPLTYIPTSHRLTQSRILWEHRRANAACAARTAGNLGQSGGSFRINKSELAELSLPDPVSFAVPANTLVVANVFGFHRRGDGQAGTRRLALYGNHRPQPFRLLGS